MAKTTIKTIRVQDLPMKDRLKMAAGVLGALALLIFVVLPLLGFAVTTLFFVLGCLLVIGGGLFLWQLFTGKSPRR